MSVYLQGMRKYICWMGYTRTPTSVPNQSHTLYVQYMEVTCKPVVSSK
jgi:hypothetical protein